MNNSSAKKSSKLIFKYSIIIITVLFHVVSPKYVFGAKLEDFEEEEALTILYCRYEIFPPLPPLIFWYVESVELAGAGGETEERPLFLPSFLSSFLLVLFLPQPSRVNEPWSLCLILAKADTPVTPLLPLRTTHSTDSTLGAIITTI